MAEPSLTPAREPTYQNGQLRFERRGVPPTPFADFYHLLMGATWRGVLGLFALGYLTLNLLFALLYFAGGEGTIVNARAGSFLDAFWFSVQTFATIGYGVLSPGTTYAHLLVAIESFSGMLCVALGTGILFSKFSRPKARVSFSQCAVCYTRNGQRCLAIRVANLRTASLVDVQVKMHVLVDEVSQEGHQMRRAYPLELERAHMPVFLLAWSMFHPLNEKSPLFGLEAENVFERMVSIIVSFTGVDDTMVQTVHARHLYTPEELRFRTRFADMMDRSETGKLIVDYERMDQLVAEGASND